MTVSNQLLVLLEITMSSRRQSQEMVPTTQEMSQEKHSGSEGSGKRGGLNWALQDV